MNEPELISCTRDTFDGEKWHHCEFAHMAAESTLKDEQLIRWAENREAELKRRKHA